MFIWETGVLWWAGLIDFHSGTHGGSPVDLVPAAEDEAGFSVVHPERNKKEKKKRHERQVERSLV